MSVQKSGKFQVVPIERMVRSLQENRVRNKKRHRRSSPRHAVDAWGHEGTERRRYERAVALNALPAQMMWLGGLDWPVGRDVAVAKTAEVVDRIMYKYRFQ